jgi:hypothetical protein
MLVKSQSTSSLFLHMRHFTSPGCQLDVKRVNGCCFEPKVPRRRLATLPVVELNTTMVTAE